MVALDANGNKLPYNDSVGNCNIFAIQDRDISTVDIYILDYIQYMDELKGEDNYNNNETNQKARNGATFSTNMQNTTRPYTSNNPKKKRRRDPDDPSPFCYSIISK